MRATSFVLLTSLALSAVSAVAQTPQFIAERVARIGSVDGPGALSLAFSLEIRPDGGVLVGEPQIPGIMVFDSRGEFERVIGRRGHGPGEYSLIGWLGWRADTLYALDHGRIHFYSAELDHLSTHRIAVRYSGSPDVMLVMPGPLTADGNILAYAEPTPRAEQKEKLKMPLLLLDRSGEHVATIGLVRAANRSVHIQLPLGQRVRATNPWRDDDLWMITADGSTVVIATRTLASDSPERAQFSVIALGMSGDTVYRRTYSYTPHELERDDYEEAIRSMANRLSSGKDVSAAVIADMLKDALPRPRTHPPLSAIVAGRDGTLWLRREAPGPGVTWIILNAEGTLIGSVELPSGLRVLRAELGRVWGVRRDDLDVPFIEVWQITRQLHLGRTSKECGESVTAAAHPQFEFRACDPDGCTCFRVPVRVRVRS